MEKQQTTNEAVKYIPHMFAGQPKRWNTSIKQEDTIQTVEGETIEAKLERILNNKDGISEGAELIYTTRADGVLPTTNVRTDRWELAIEAKDQQTKQYLAQREEREAAKQQSKEQSTDQNQGKSQES